LPRVHCIFTAISISLSLEWRQCGHRYAIRAGRNLPDKEFRYLRTVIVTAAVYWGFDQELSLPHLTFQHRAGVTPYTSSITSLQSAVFLLNSRSHLVSETHLAMGIPSPEVTVLICLVPSLKFSQHLSILNSSTCVGLRYG
jgi:hypothetical protein